MYGAALVEIVAANCCILYHLDSSWLSGLLSVLDSISDQPSPNMLNLQTYDGPIRTFNDPRVARFKKVKNSVLKTQFNKESGSDGEPTPIANQSSLKFEQLTYLMAPTGIVLSA